MANKKNAAVLVRATHSRSAVALDGSRYRWERGELYRVDPDMFNGGLPSCFVVEPKGGKVPEHVDDGRSRP